MFKTSHLNGILPSIALVLALVPALFGQGGSGVVKGTVSDSSNGGSKRQTPFNQSGYQHRS